MTEIGRLRRETNPVPGERPGFTPQHELEDGSFVNTGENNPYPVKVKNLPDIQKVSDGDAHFLLENIMTEVQNLKTRLSQQLNVNVGNLPSNQAVNDAQALAKLQDLETKLIAIDMRLNAVLDVKGTISVENFPANQAVTDVNVKAELEMVKEELQALKKQTHNVQLTGSYVCLSTEVKPQGEQGNTLLEYNPDTKETKVYKYISGDWREL